MKRYFLLSLLLFVNIVVMFSDATDDYITENTKISKTEIKIGEKINITVKIPGLENAKVLWQDITYSDGSADIIAKKEYYKEKIFNIDIDFTFFKPGSYKNFLFTVPISVKGGDVVYLTTNKYNITVISPMTEEEIQNIKDMKDPSKIELRKEKEQAKFNFTFVPYIKIIVIVILVLLAGLVLYFILYKKFSKLKGSKIAEKKLPPYEQFLADVAMVEFKIDDSRPDTENKLSSLTETLKELLYGEFDLNAPSETTRELVYSLKEINFNDEILIDINKLFIEIDMIKFAKSGYDFDRLVYFLNSVKELGGRINNIYRMKTAEKEKTDANIPT